MRPAIALSAINEQSQANEREKGRKNAHKEDSQSLSLREDQIGRVAWQS